MKKVFLYILVFVLFTQTIGFQREVSASAEMVMQPNVEYTANIQSYSDVDTYKLSINNPSSVKIGFKHEDANEYAQWKITLYTLNNEDLTHFYSANDQINLSSYKVRVPVGTYYIKVESLSSLNDMDYKIIANVTDESASNYEREDNDSRSLSQTISVNKEYTGNIQDAGDIDFYRLDITAPSSVKIGFKHEDANEYAQWKITLYTLNNEDLTHFYSANDQINLSSYKVRVPVGTYYIKVESLSLLNDMDYKIIANVTDESASNYEREDNDSRSLSQTISVNKEYTGNIQDAGDVDFYRLDITAPSSVKIGFKHEDANEYAQWKITLYILNNEEVTSLYSANDQINLSSDKVTVPVGTCYIKVESLSSLNDMDYIIGLFDGSSSAPTPTPSPMPTQTARATSTLAPTVKPMATQKPTPASNTLDTFDTMPNGTVVIGNKAFSLAYANNVVNLAIIQTAIVANSSGTAFIKGFDGKWVDNASGMTITDLTLIDPNAPAPTPTGIPKQNVYDNSIPKIDGFVFDPVAFGSNITFTATGYPTAAKFQVFSGNTPITAITNLGMKTLIFPKVNVGDDLAVKLLTTDGTLVILKWVTLSSIQIATTPTATPTSTPSTMPAATPTYSAIKAFITDANYGSAILVTAPGFPTAVKFILYSGTNPISEITNLGINTIVYPVQNAGEIVNVVLFAADGTTQIATHDVTLVDPNSLPPTDTPTPITTIIHHVTGVKLNKISLTLSKGRTYKLTATVNPSNARNKKVTWKSGNTKIVTVSSSGTIKGIKKGTVNIYVYTVDGKKSAKCKVTIK